MNFTPEPRPVYICTPFLTHWLKCAHLCTQLAFLIATLPQPTSSQLDAQQESFLELTLERAGELLGQRQTRERQQQEKQRQLRVAKAP